MKKISILFALIFLAFLSTNAQKTFSYTKRMRCSYRNSDSTTYNCIKDTTKAVFKINKEETFITFKIGDKGEETKFEIIDTDHDKKEGIYLYFVTQNMSFAFDERNKQAFVIFHKKESDSIYFQFE